MLISSFGVDGKEGLLFHLSIYHDCKYSIEIVLQFCWKQCALNLIYMLMSS